MDELETQKYYMILIFVLFSLPPEVFNPLSTALIPCEDVL